VTAEQSSVNNKRSSRREKLPLNRRFDRTNVSSLHSCGKRILSDKKKISYGRPRSVVKIYFSDIIGVKSEMYLVESNTIIYLKQNIITIGTLIEFGQRLTFCHKKIYRRKRPTCFLSVETYWLLWRSRDGHYFQDTWHLYFGTAFPKLSQYSDVIMPLPVSLP